MQNGRPQITPRKKMLLNDYRQPLPCTDAPLEGGKYPAQLMFEQANNGKIVLKVNDGVFKEGANNGKMKEVELDWAHRNMLFEALLEATTDKNFKVKQIPIRWKQFVMTGGQGRMSDQPITQATLTITRDDHGVIFLGYSKGADYKAQFRFKGPKDTVVMIRNDQGERVEDHGLMSRWAVRAWVNFHRPILDQMETSAWEPPKPRDGGNGNGNGNGGQRQGNGPSQNNFDDNFDDIDF